MHKVSKRHYYFVDATDAFTETDYYCAVGYAVCWLGVFSQLLSTIQFTKY